MVKMNWSGLVVLTAVTLGLATSPSAQADDARAPMVRPSEQRPVNAQRGAGAVHVAQARSSAGLRRDSAQQRAAAVERRETPKPAQMKRAAPTRVRAEAERGGNGTPRSR